jgi:predicted transcriptional regulator
MAISNELSSEIAAALLAEKKSPQELKQLKDVVLKVHSTLQQTSADERANRLRGEEIPPTAAKSQTNQL